MSPYLETVLILKEGRQLPVELSVSNFMIEGQIAGRVAVLRDITERKQAEAILRESEARFQLLANVAPVLIWVNGLDGCEFVNRPYLEFLGVSSETDVRSYDWTPYVHPDDRKAYIESYLTALAARVPFAAQFRFRRADGVYRWFQSMGTPRFLSNGTFLGYVGCSFDITEMRETAAVLEQCVTERTAALEHSPRAAALARGPKAARKKYAPLRGMLPGADGPVPIMGPPLHPECAVLRGIA